MNNFNILGTFLYTFRIILLNIFTPPDIIEKAGSKIFILLPAFVIL